MWECGKVILENSSSKQYFSLFTCYHCMHNWKKKNYGKNMRYCAPGVKCGSLLQFFEHTPNRQYPDVKHKITYRKRRTGLYKYVPVSAICDFHTRILKNISYVTVIYQIAWSKYTYSYAVCCVSFFRPIIVPPTSYTNFIW